MELLRVVADGRVLPWVPRLLADPDEGIQNWTASLLDQLVWSGFIDPDDQHALFENALAHPNPQVRATIERLLEWHRGRG